MSKIWTVFKSEYLRRVKSKSFILITLLVPVAIALLIAVVAVLTVSALEEDETRTIAILDETRLLQDALINLSDASYTFVATELAEDSLRSAVLAGTYDGYLVLPAAIIQGDAGATYYAPDAGGSVLQNRLRRRVEQTVEAQRLLQQNVAPEVLALLNADVPVRVVKLTETGEEAGDNEFFMVLGFAMGFMISMMMIIYGSVVMQGVIEEKTSRVVEVVISSVKPFELMMGKVTAIGAMGLTQIFAWALLTTGVVMAIGVGASLFIDPGSITPPEEVMEATPGQGVGSLMEAAGIDLPDLPLSLFFWFVLYFLFGYLLFATLYAAVGSIVESQQDAQGFLIPIMLPIIIAMYTLVPQIESPNSTLAVTLSMLPLTSPISMMVRMAVTDVPLWQMLLSFLLLVGGFLAGTWLSGRIYRVGILMHGKKPSLKEVMRWIRYA